MAEYAKRDIESQGEHYLKHVAAMTTEGLYSKADIAAELAHRDIRIEELKEEVRRWAITAIEYGDNYGNSNTT